MTGVGLSIARMADTPGFVSASFLDGLPAWCFKPSPPWTDDDKVTPNLEGKKFYFNVGDG